MQLPGNKLHQKILQSLINLFQQNKNIRAFIVFGSLVRENWDKYSDLDLDVVIKDTSEMLIKQVVESIKAKLRSEQVKILLYFEEFTNEFVFIFDSLDRMSIRFHLLEETHPAIISSMKILYGDLNVEKIKASQNKALNKEINYQLLHYKFLEHAIYVQLSIKRNKFINATFFLNKMRQIIIELYVGVRNKRLFDFEDMSDEKIKSIITSSFSNLNKENLRKNLEILINLYSNQIKQITLGRIKLTDNERSILNKVVKY